MKDYFTNADLFVDLQNSFNQWLAYYFVTNEEKEQQIAIWCFCLQMVCL